MELKLAFFLCVVLSLAFATDLANCSIISASGDYTLTQNLTGYSYLNWGIYGECLWITVSNVSIDCAGHSIYGDLSLSTDTAAYIVNTSNITVKNCLFTGYGNGMQIELSDSVYLYNLTIRDGITGLSIGNNDHNSYNFRVENNTVYNMTDTGIYFKGSYNSFLNNNIYDIVGGTWGYCFNSYGGVDNNLTNNKCNNVHKDGFEIYNGAEGYIIRNNTFSNATLNGIWAHDNGGVPGANIYIDNLFADNTLSGFKIDGATGTSVIANNTVYGNNEYGITTTNTLTTISNTHFFNNTVDFYTTSNVAMTGSVFDSPQGNYQNYTNLSITDTLSGESYSLKWAAQPATPPAENYSFAQKFVNISILSGTVSIDNITWKLARKNYKLQ